jgi:thioredoxin reductase
MIDRYLAPLSSLPEIAPGLRLRHRVVHVARAGFDKLKTEGRDQAPFLVRAETPSGMQDFLASAVIDATGTWATPNPLGANGLPAAGEREHADRIAYGMPDVLGAMRSRYAGKRVLVAGAGHSAIGTLLALTRLADEAPGTQVAWALRGHNLARILGGGDNDGLPARGALGARVKALRAAGRLEIHTDFRIEGVRAAGRGLEVFGLRDGTLGHSVRDIDEIVVATGSRPDFSLASELRVKLDPWIESTEALAPLIDPNVHSCGTVRPHGHRELAHPERGYYALGAKSYGRAPNFLMATGYEQARSVVAVLAGDLAAADDVQLELPQTGVCSTQLAEDGAAGSACCGGPPVKLQSACCVQDEVAKVAGKAGCGCR